MRLLRSADLTFEEFMGDELPPYAILSHMWYPAKEEITYQQMCSGLDTTKRGYEKIVKFAKVARQDGHHFIWVDTCCIDKSSSAELSEAINSMFRWYQDAAVCYAYMHDLTIKVDQAAGLDDASIEMFEKSKWFTRGWTLQELLAPKDVLFFSSDWRAIGDTRSLNESIQRATRIPASALSGTPLQQFSIAQRMSWASDRVTTRVEDTAYCLMGIFDINMPLLYGEREKAFQRLQRLIAEDSSDQSIFAWKDPSLAEDQEISIFATSPRQFRDSGDIVSLEFVAWTDDCRFTSPGLRIELFFVDGHQLISRHSRGHYLVSLECYSSSSWKHSPAIHVRQLTGLNESWRSNHNTRFVRVAGNKLELLSNRDKSTGFHSTVCMQLAPPAYLAFASLPPELTMCYIGWHKSPSDEYFTGHTMFPKDSWDRQIQAFMVDKACGPFGAIVDYHKHTSTMTIFGLRAKREPWIVSLCEAAQPGDWMSYMPSGTETQSSYVVLSQSTSSREVYKSQIWRPDPTSDQIFCIDIGFERH